MTLQGKTGRLENWKAKKQAKVAYVGYEKEKAIAWKE